MLIICFAINNIFKSASRTIKSYTICCLRYGNDVVRLFVFPNTCSGKIKGLASIL